MVVGARHRHEVDRIGEISNNLAIAMPLREPARRSIHQLDQPVSPAVPGPIALMHGSAIAPGMVKTTIGSRPRVKLRPAQRLVVHIAERAVGQPAKHSPRTQ